MILEYCNSDIYFDIYIISKKKTKHERFSLVVVFFFLIRHPLLPLSKCLISKLKDRGKKTTKKKRNGKIRLELKKEHGGEVR